MMVQPSLKPTPLSLFKQALKRGDRPGPAALHKHGTFAEPLNGRAIKFTISTGSVDREGDTVAINGWQLGAFKTNPVVLWGHQTGELPIGKCTAIGVEGGALKAVVEFVPADMPAIGPLAEAVLRMSRDGFLSATSVGFRPLQFELAKDRDDGQSWFPPIDFLKQDLLEFSIVSIPANPEALIDPPERRPATPGAAPADNVLAFPAPPKLTLARALTTLQALSLGYSMDRIAAMRRAGTIRS